ncbi:hypothetical protein H4582DRAFT_1982935 [Lactarius indigo]|nr:hypothetical protein H4582DRAFT_1982935 [Lactarius indigo]
MTAPPGHGAIIFSLIYTALGSLLDSSTGFTCERMWVIIKRTSNNGRILDGYLPAYQTRALSKPGSGQAFKIPLLVPPPNVPPEPD